jgi:photosystem II stability/assembly factor-like uncharacterized protein
MRCKGAASGKHGVRGLFGAIVSLSCIGVAAAQQKDDGAEMAEMARLAPKSLLLDLARAGNRIVAVGERGHVLFSDDEGIHWHQARTVPTRDLLTAVCFADAKHGIAVGHDEVILTTQDAGIHWRRTHFAPEAQQPLLDVWCGGSNAIAVGAYGAYYTSEDHGATWKARRLDAKPVIAATRSSSSGASGSTQDGSSAYEDDLGGDPHLNRIVAASPTRFYIAGEAGHLYRSDDSGSTWVQLLSPYTGSFFGLLPLDGDSLLAYGLRGHLFRSDDGGKSWTAVETDTIAMLNDAVRIGATQIAVAGLAGALLESHDGGRTFEQRHQLGRKGLSAILAVESQGGAGEVVVVGEGGVRRIALEQEGAP